MTNKRILTFEVAPDGCTLDVHFDNHGLEELLSILQRMNGADEGHEHLFTKEWGGGELSDEIQGSDARLIQKVTLHKWS